VAKVAATVAASNGDSRVTTAKWIAATRQDYLSALGEGSANDGSANQEEIVVVMAGHFIASRAHVPPGAAQPHGDVIDFAWDPTTGRVTDWGIDGSMPSLAKLGQSRALQLMPPTASATPSVSPN